MNCLSTIDVRTRCIVSTKDATETAMIFSNNLSFSQHFRFGLIKLIIKGKGKHMFADDDKNKQGQGGQGGQQGQS